MAVSTTAKLNLRKRDDTDLTWGHVFRQSYDELESRLTKSGLGDPISTATNADFSGQVYIDVLNKEVYFALAAGPPTNWLRKNTISEAVILADSLSVEGFVTLNGQLELLTGFALMATQGIVIGSEQTMQGIGAYIDNSVAIMNPMQHADRHKDGTGADPVLEFVGNFMQKLRYQFSSVPTVIPQLPLFTDTFSIIVDTTGRSGDSLIFAFAEIEADSSAPPTIAKDVHVEIRLNNGFWFRWNIHGLGIGKHMYFYLDTLVADVVADFSLSLYNDTVTANPEVQFQGLGIIDFGVLP